MGDDWKLSTRNRGAIGDDSLGRSYQDVDSKRERDDDRILQWPDTYKMGETVRHELVVQIKLLDLFFTVLTIANHIARVERDRRRDADR